MFQVNKDIMTKLTSFVNIKDLFNRCLINNYFIDFFARYDKVVIVTWTIKETRIASMISINTNSTPLDFDISLSDFLRQLMQHNRQIRSDKLIYNYQETLTIKEPIGKVLLPETLIYYPELSRQIRKLNKLDFDVELNLKNIESIFQQGLAAIIKSLNYIQDILHDVRCEKAKLDAQINNLIYLYGQERTLPVIRAIKPWFHNRANAYQHGRTTRYIINISGINYYLHYQGNRFGLLKRLFTITSHQLLSHYFETTKLDANAISPCEKTEFIGGIINTPIVAFRVKQSYRHRGKKYFVDLATCQTYTRLADLKEVTRQYSDCFNLKLIKD
jgi:hypothetical protein